jgi:hypothetical protein
VDVLILTERHPACRWREAQPGSCKERENLAGDAKGKGTSGSHRKAESTDAPERGRLLRSSDEAAVMVVERRGRVIDDESGPTGNGRSPKLNGRRQPSIDGTSRMNREVQVLICERLGVKFPGSTRQKRKCPGSRGTSVLPSGADIVSLHQHVRLVPYPDSCIAANCASFDHLVGANEYRGRHGKAERSGSLHVDHQLELGRLLYRQIGRLGALENLVHVVAGTTPYIG